MMKNIREKMIKRTKKNKEEDDYRVEAAISTLIINALRDQPHKSVQQEILCVCVCTFVGGARVRFASTLELREESLMSDATLAESERRSSQEPALLEGRGVGLRLCAATA